MTNPSPEMAPTPPSLRSAARVGVYGLLAAGSFVGVKKLLPEITLSLPASFEEPDAANNLELAESTEVCFSAGMDDEGVVEIGFNTSTWCVRMVADVLDIEEPEVVDQTPRELFDGVNTAAAESQAKLDASQETGLPVDDLLAGSVALLVVGGAVVGTWALQDIAAEGKRLQAAKEQVIFEQQAEPEPEPHQGSFPPLSVMFADIRRDAPIRDAEEARRQNARDDLVSHQQPDIIGSRRSALFLWFMGRVGRPEKRPARASDTDQVDESLI